MPSERECLCCVELDHIKYNLLGGMLFLTLLQIFKKSVNFIFSIINSFVLLEKKCITEHEDFHPIVLLKNNLYTALVALHDFNSRAIQDRDRVENR